MTARIQTIRDMLHIATKIKHRGYMKPFQLIEQKLQDKGALSMPHADDQNTIRLRYKIPAAVCTSNNRTQMSLSGFLAIFDDVTTWAMMSVDRSKRAGVSISLGCHLANRTPVVTNTNGLSGIMPSAGDAVDITTRVDKIGRNLGFASVEARHVESGQCICIGYHTKFLPMGWLYETAYSPFLFPVTRTIMSMLTHDKSGETGDKNSSDGCGVAEGGHLSDLLLVKDKSISANDDFGRYSLDLNDSHYNMLGTMHGGCQAMVYEEVGRMAAMKDCFQNMRSAPGESCHPNLESIHIDYLSSERKAVDIQSQIFQCDASSASMRLEMRSGGSDALVSRSKLAWRV